MRVKVNKWWHIYCCKGEVSVMVGYDFDKTIYNGDSFIDFYLFVLLRFPYLIIILPFQLIAMALVCSDKKRVKEVLAFYLRLVPNKERLIVRFW